MDALRSIVVSPSAISPSKPLYPDAKVDILRLGPTDAKGVFV
ncbi:hypothetical protein SAMN05216496_3397 [Pseudomonas sp. Z003-0.4C(8344-21)]|nr:hypothetical protein SAMN05216579_2246 [Pseudomonas granadensis]SDT14108.1 hypothetical protein SAMN05216496_3397 [Pseudomonas sp. Z003-0.4C(8344-21)]